MAIFSWGPVSANWYSNLVEDMTTVYPAAGEQLALQSTYGLSDRTFLQVDDELVRCSAVVDSTHVLVAERGADGTVAAVHQRGSVIAVTLVPAHINELRAVLASVLWACSYADFADAIEACGSEAQDLIVRCELTATGTIVVPATCNVVFERGGSINIGIGSTVTFESPEHIAASERQQIFSGAGTVSFTTRGIVSQAWWGSTTTVGIQEAIDSLPSGVGVVRIPAGTYTPTVSVVPTSGLVLVGDGPNRTIINWGQTGFLFDNNTTDGMEYLAIKGMKINVTSGGTGGIRLGDPTATYGALSWHFACELSNLYVQGPAQANTIGIDLTQMMQLLMQDVWVNNFAVNQRFVTLAESLVQNVRNQVCTDTGLLIDQTQAGTLGGADETVFQNYAISGVRTGATGLHIDGAARLRFQGIFIESYSGEAPTNWVLMEDCNEIAFYGMTFANDVPTNVMNISNCQTLTLDNVMLVDLGEFGASVSVVFPDRLFSSGAEVSGGVRVINCPYNFNLLFEGIPWVMILGEDRYPSLTTRRQPITGQTSLWAKQLANRQGQCLFPEANYVLSAFHGQTHYESANLVEVVADADCSGGWGLEPTGVGGQEFVGIELSYPEDILPGSYEMIVRLKAKTGTSNVNMTIEAIDGVGVINWNVFAGVGAAMEVLSIRVNIAEGNLAGASVVRFRVNGTTSIIVDYIAVRPAYNDLFLQDYIATDASAAGGGHRMAFGAAAPGAGYWDQGDIVFSNAPAAGGVPGWVCTTGGTPGTWKAMANLAA